MAGKKAVPRAQCPACRKIIELERKYKRRELLTCPHCGQVLEVISVHPQQLDFPLDPSIPYSGRNYHRLG